MITNKYKAVDSTYTSWPVSCTVANSSIRSFWTPFTWVSLAGDSGIEISLQSMCSSITEVPLVSQSKTESETDGLLSKIAAAPVLFRHTCLYMLWCHHVVSLPTLLQDIGWWWKRQGNDTRKWWRESKLWQNLPCFFYFSTWQTSLLVLPYSKWRLSFNSLTQQHLCFTPYVQNNPTLGPGHQNASSQLWRLWS